MNNKVPKDYEEAVIYLTALVIQNRGHVTIDTSALELARQRVETERLALGHDSRGRFIALTLQKSH